MRRCQCGVPLAWGALALAVAFALTAGGPAFAAQDAASGVPERLSSPRATFATFLEAVNARRLDEAVECLDVSPVLRGAAGQELARKLKDVIDKTAVVDLERIPSAPPPDLERWRWEPLREIELERQPDGRWLFSRRTVERIDALYDRVRGKAYVKGLETAGAVGRPLAERLEDRLPDWLRETYFLKAWQWLALLIVALAGFVLDRIVRFVVAAQVKRRFLRRIEALQQASAVRFERPVGLLATGLFWQLALPPLLLPASAMEILLLAARFVVAFAGVWAAYRLVDVAALYFGHLAAQTESKLDDLLVPLLRKSAKVVVVAFGLVFVAQNLDMRVGALITGLGLGGAAVALAAKDSVENLFGSLTVLVDRPFQLGDWVNVEGIDGTVEEVGIRSTRLRTFYNSVVTIPNSRLVRAVVDNYGLRRYRRVKAMLGIEYGTPPEKIEAFCEGIRELIREHPYTRKDFYLVYFNEFGPSSLNILLYAFHETPDWPTELRERHRLFVDIVRLARTLGVNFAFPTQTLHLASVPPGSPWDAARPPSRDPLGPTPADQAPAMGREQAERIVKNVWKGETQPPVRFDDPDGMPPR